MSSFFYQFIFINNNSYFSSFTFIPYCYTIFKAIEVHGFDENGHNSSPSSEAICVWSSCCWENNPEEFPDESMFFFMIHRSIRFKVNTLPNFKATVSFR